MKPLTLLLLCLLLPGCAGKSPSGKGDAKPAGASPDTASSQGELNIPADRQRLAGIAVATIAPRVVPRTLVVPGQVAMDEERTSHIAPYSDGRVLSVRGMEGDVVRRGDTLAEIHSHAVHETVGALAQNYAAVSRGQAALLFAQQQQARYQHLYSIQAASLEQRQASDQQLVQAQAELASAQAAVTMEREHLADLLQIAPASIAPATLASYENVPIKTPIAGTIVHRAITPGMVLEPGVEAFVVSDLHVVWVVAAINQVDLPLLRLGQQVQVHTDAWPNRTFSGRVTLIGSSLDPATRTVQLRATLAAAHGELKPQMFTTVTVEQGATRKALFVPEAALQDVNGVATLFVTADGTHFVPRAVKTLPAVHGEVEVDSGLQANERVATAGAFMIKSQLLKGALGEE